MNRPDWRRCIAFHGHVCPGIAIGYRAARGGLDLLDEARAADEEIVAIVENDACGTDAVQVLTGCTFGKGNFIFKDFGKQAFTFFSRSSGKGVRIVLRPEALDTDERQQALIQKIREEIADADEQAEYHQYHLNRTRKVLSMPFDILFKIESVCVPLPEKARIVSSARCDRCGEPVMSTMLTDIDGQEVCRGCLETAGIGQKEG